MTTSVWWDELCFGATLVDEELPEPIYPNEYRPAWTLECTDRVDNDPETDDGGLVDILEETTPDRLKKHETLMRQYGIGLRDYDRMLAEQGHRCKICGVHEIELRRGLYVDHCHATHQVRGLLCNTCNFGLGAFRDSRDLLRAAMRYLRGPYPDVDQSSEAMERLMAARAKDATRAHLVSIKEREAVEDMLRRLNGEDGPRAA